MNKIFVYSENGIEKDYLEENRRKNEILEHNKRLTQEALSSNNCLDKEKITYVAL